MATLCPQAEEIIRERNIVLKPISRQKLATYDPDTQVKWLVNPMVQCLVEKSTNEFLARCLQRKHSIQTPIVKPSPDVNPPTPDPGPNTSDDSDKDEPNVFCLFDDDNDY